MNCLNGYIGLKGCSVGAPGSGLYINSLPGMPTELFDAIANADQQTSVNVWNDIQATAQAQMLIDISNAFSSRYKIRSIARQLDLGKNIDGDYNVVAAMRGFETDPQNAGCKGNVKSNLLGISCDELYLWIPDKGAITSDVSVKVFNASGSQTYFSYLIAADAAVTGWNTIPVNIVFPCEKLVCVYDSTQIESASLEISEAINQEWCNMICQSSGCKEKSMGRVQGVETDALNIDNITYGTDTFGLTGSFSFVCSYERIICQNKKSFARAIWFLEGHHTLFHAEYTPNFLRANTVDSEKTKALKDEFLQRYFEEMRRVVKGINLDTNDLCLECNTVYSKRWMS